MTVQVEQNLHGVDVENFEGLVEERENKEFTIGSKFDAHNFIGSLDFFIELKLQLPVFIMSKCVEFDCSIC
jgi:hypothetical protein